VIILTFKKTLNDPEKLMQYKRPMFMTGVGLAWFAARMKGQMPARMTKGFIDDAKELYTSLAPAIASTKLTNFFPQNLQNLTLGTGKQDSSSSSSSGSPSNPPMDYIWPYASKAAAVIPTVEEIADYIMRNSESKSGSKKKNKGVKYQIKAAGRWIKRKVK
jgi:hypothetical protein